MTESRALVFHAYPSAFKTLAGILEYSKLANRLVGRTPSASCKGLTVPRIGVHWRGACRAIEHSGKAVGEDTEPHREEVRAVGGLGVG